MFIFWPITVIKEWSINAQQVNCTRGSYVSYLNNYNALVCSERNTSFILENPCGKEHWKEKTSSKGIKADLPLSQHKDTRQGPSTRNRTLTVKLHDFQNYQSTLKWLSAIISSHHKLIPLIQSWQIRSMHLLSKNQAFNESTKCNPQ